MTSMLRLIFNVYNISLPQNLQNLPNIDPRNGPSTSDVHNISNFGIAVDENLGLTYTEG